MAIYWELTIAPNIRELIQKKTYEMIIWKLMNQSSEIFPGKYVQIEEQAHGECDFKDITSKQKYDAKMLFSKQCQLLKQGTERLVDWVKSVREEIAKASKKLMNNDMTGIKSTTLYKEFSQRLATVKKDEDAILFIPFPIVPDSENAVYMQFASDIVSVTYDSIVKDSPDRFKDKKTFIIYPSVIDHKFVLRNLTLFAKEDLPIDPLSPYITFTIKEYPD